MTARCLGGARSTDLTLLMAPRPRNGTVSSDDPRAGFAFMESSPEPKHVVKLLFRRGEPLRLEPALRARSLATGLQRLLSPPLCAFRRLETTLQDDNDPDGSISIVALIAIAIER